MDTANNITECLSDQIIKKNRFHGEACKHLTNLAQQSMCELVKRSRDWTEEYEIIHCTEKYILPVLKHTNTNH